MKLTHTRQYIFVLSAYKHNPRNWAPNFYELCIFCPQLVHLNFGSSFFLPPKALTNSIFLNFFNKLAKFRVTKGKAHLRRQWVSFKEIFIFPSTKESYSTSGGRSQPRLLSSPSWTLLSRTIAIYLTLGSIIQATDSYHFLSLKDISHKEALNKVEALLVRVTYCLKLFYFMWS